MSRREIKDLEQWKNELPWYGNLSIGPFIDSASPGYVSLSVSWIEPEKRGI